MDREEWTTPLFAVKAPGAKHSKTYWPSRFRHTYEKRTANAVLFSYNGTS